MKTLLKTFAGILLGGGLSWLVVHQNGINWGSAGILLAGGVGCVLVWAFTRSSKARKAANNVIVCFLSAAMAALPMTVMGEDTFAGYSGQSCYCIEPNGIQAAAAPVPGEEDNVVVLSFVVDQIPDAPIPMVVDAVPRIITMYRPDPTTLVSWEQTAQTFAEYGIDLNAINSTQYAKNGRAVAPSEVPFTLGGWSQSFTLYPERKQYKVIVETSPELGEFARWQPVSRFSVPAGVPIQYQDTPDGLSAFYRLRLDTSDPQQAIFQPAGPILIGCGLGLLGGAAVVCVLTVRACARNKKKFDDLKKQMTNNPPNQVNFNLAPAPAF